MTDRAQTTLDFAVGVSLFLGVVVLAFAFMPSMFAPFETDTGAEFVVADRAADRLSADALVESPADPSVLDADCTADFFDADGTAPPTCRYDDDAAALRPALGLDGNVRVNVTVRDDAGIRTLDGTRLAAGPSPTTVDDTVVATRVVLLDDQQNRLYVRVW
ncbi:DUF7287 family protein [Haloplanus natans]|uniref:DUF7287 family protein n=1 Tax=Haloplanus natans TaxID=376171 RepID=UPI000677C25D|nr:hypothetical protein [Haloplanus natans]